MATATAPKMLTSSRYPGWEIRRVGAEFLMTRAGGVFAIGVGFSEEHGWVGQLLTRQRGAWRPAWTPYEGSVIGCVAEIERRERIINKRRAGR